MQSHGVLQPAAGKTRLANDRRLRLTYCSNQNNGNQTSHCTGSHFRCNARLGAMQSFIILWEAAQSMEHLLGGPEGQTFIGNVALKLVEQTDALCHFPIPAALGHSPFSFELECLFYVTNTQLGRSMHISSCTQGNQFAQGLTVMCNSAVSIF